MTVKDVIKSSIYESLGGGTGLSAKSIIFILIAACCMGLYIYAVYKLTGKAAFYSKDLNTTIAGLPVIVAAIMVAMQSNLIVSLGMVALSIVRFRNAVKNPLDLLYLFWTISAGIISGVGMLVLAIVLCLVMTAMMMLLERLPDFKAVALLIIRTECDGTDWAEVKKNISQYCKYSKEKSRSIRSGETEIIIEVKTTKKEELLKELKQKNNFKQIHFLSHDGEYRI